MRAYTIPRPLRASGFGLIELMVAMTLGLLVVGAAFAVFQSNQRTFVANEGINRIQEGARVAYEMMSRDLRAAGGSACSNLALPAANHSNTTEETAFLTAPVSGSGSEFTVVSGDDAAYPITSATTNSVTINVSDIKTNPESPNYNPDFVLTDEFKSGDKVIICNANQLYIVAISNVSGSTVSYSPATPVVMTADPMAPNATVRIAHFRSNRWFLDGGSLKVERDGGTAQAVIDNVGAMSMTYLERGQTSYSASPSLWSNVVAVRLSMTLNGKDSVDGNTISRNFSNAIALRSRTP